MTKAREPLTRGRVLAAAIDVADAEGLAGLTMRRLAGSLGVEAMALYHHLPNKDAVLDGVVEALVARVREEVTALGPPDGDWRTDLRARCLAARRVMVAHPWAPALITTRTSVPPSVYVWFDEVLGVMVRGGLGMRLAHRALHALGSMTLGFVQELFSPGAAGDAPDDAGEEELAAMAEMLPNLTAMVAAELHDHTDPVLGWCDSQVEFEFTLDLILDGLERLRQAG